MPIDGLPDPAIHRLCLRCRRWHEPSEGVTVFPDGPDIPHDPISAVVVGLSHAMVPRTKERFICHACRRRRRLITWSIYGALVLVLIAVMLRACFWRA